MVFLWVALLALCVQHIFAVDVEVDLGYAKYKGVEQDDEVSRWLGMRFARAPTPENGLRFMAPQDPVDEDGVQDASQFGLPCIPTGAKANDNRFSEDCLFVNVFAPSNATEDSKFPVYIFLQGGGFNSDANWNMNGSELINAAERELVIVVFNYRVGPYGFLASEEIASNKTLSLNNGLKDQRKGLEWVQKYISKFGGDPGHVTLGGSSAGGSSVVLHLLAYGGRDDKLFHAAAAESQAFPAMRNVTDNQFQYDALIKAAGCKNLKCLVSLSGESFQAAAANIHIPYPGAPNPPIFFWNPVLDYDFIQDYQYNELKLGRFVQVPTIFGDDTNEGITFTPKTVDNQLKAQQFIASQFVNFNKSATYLLSDTDSAFEKQATTEAAASGNNKWQLVAADMYGHIRYICPGLNMSNAYAHNGTSPTYSYRWNVGTATHVSEMGGIWNNGSTATNICIQNYWVSFTRSYDPNKYKGQYVMRNGTAFDCPDWEEFGTAQGRRMLFGADKNTLGMEDVSSMETDKCQSVNGLGIQLRQVASAASNMASWSPHLKYIVSMLCLAQWIWHSI